MADTPNMGLLIPFLVSSPTTHTVKSGCGKSIKLIHSRSLRLHSLPHLFLGYWHVLIGWGLIIVLSLSLFLGNRIHLSIIWILGRRINCHHLISWLKESSSVSNDSSNTFVYSFSWERHVRPSILFHPSTSKKPIPANQFNLTTGNLIIKWPTFANNTIIRSSSPLCRLSLAALNFLNHQHPLSYAIPCI